MPEVAAGENRIARWIATNFGLGDVLPAPGTTAGSLPAAALWWAGCAVLSSPSHRILMTAAGAAVFTAVGLWACEVEGRRRGMSDPGPVVVDEVAVQWLCYLAALPFVDLAGAGDLALFTLIGFLLFRLFDVVKPWPTRRLERLNGGLGVVADDLAAGLQAAIVLVLGYRLLGS